MSKIELTMSKTLIGQSYNGELHHFGDKDIQKVKEKGEEGKRKSL